MDLLRPWIGCVAICVLAPAALSYGADPPAKDAPAKPAPGKVAANEDTAEDTAKEDTAKEDTAKEDTAKEDTAKEDTAKEDTAKKDASKPAAKSPPAPLGRFVSLNGVVDDTLFGRVKNNALTLQNKAQQQQRKAVLVLEIPTGSSQFHQVHGLAKFLTSNEISNVKTVAWVPETLTGNNVVLALACQEIVMHPDAEIGDIGRGKPLDRDEQQDVLRLVEKRHNPLLSPALVLGMMDPEKETLRAKVQMLVDGRETAESRILSKDELQRLRETKAVILDVQTIKETGDIGLYSGAKARGLGVLAVQTVAARSEIADLYKLEQEALRDDPTMGEKPRVQLVKIDGMIEPVLETFLERQIERAASSGVNTIIFHIDSPGGYLLPAQNLAFKIAEFDPKKVRTIAYIPHEALSSAAIIALGCDEIYLTPRGRIGDAEPMEIGQGQQFQRVPEKLLSNLKVVLGKLATTKNRPPALIQAMADRNLKVFEVKHRKSGRIWYMTESELHASNGEWEKGAQLPDTGGNQLLTVDGDRAHHLGLAQPPVADFDELKTRLGIPPELNISEARRTWVDSLVFLLNTDVALFFLFFVGCICLYIELHTMTGFFAILSAVCFAILFWSRFLGGTAGWLEVILFVIGAGCLALEFFILPGFGVFGVTGLLLCFSAIVLATQTAFNFDSAADLHRLSTTVGTLAGSIVSIFAVAVLLSRFLPHMPMFDKLVLTPPGMEHHRGPRLKPELEQLAAGGSGHEYSPSLVGQEGQAMTVLRPAGKAKIDGRLMDVVSDGPFIQQDSRIEVVAVSGHRVVVRQIG